MSLFVVLLKFTDRRPLAAAALPAHNEWLRRGFDEGVFLLAGSLAESAGGALLATCATRDDLQRRVDADPFVEQGIVLPEIQQIAPGRADPRLAFLLPR